MPRSAEAIFVYSCFLLLAFTSCVDNEPVIDEARVSAVFDYSGESVEARLSVFANVRSDLDLAAEIRLVNEEANLQWSCRDLTKFQDTAKNDWVGYAAFVSPEGDAIAKGKYVLTYEDSCEREGELVFVVDYPDGLLEKIIDESQSELPQEDQEGDSEGALDGDGEASADEAQSGTGGGVLSEASQGAALQADHESTTQEHLSQEDSASISAAQQAAQIAQDAPSQVGQQGDALAEAQSSQVDTQGDEDGVQGDDKGEERQLELRRAKRDVFKHKTLDEVRAILGKGVQKKIALYSSEHELLYFGEQEDDTLSKYKDAAFSKMCLCTQDDAVICVFAETPISHKKKGAGNGK